MSFVAFSVSPNFTFTSSFIPHVSSTFPPTSSSKFCTPTLSLSDPASPLFVSKSFASLGLSPPLLSSLSSQSIQHPTKIQSRAIPLLLTSSSALVGAATGSGKTLAYLLPLIQQLKHAESLRNENDPPLRVARRPRALVLVPTRELADQVAAVAKQLSHHAKVRVVGLVGGANAMTGRKLRDTFERPVDILVSTTGRLSQLMEQRLVDVRFVRHVVVDEVDTLVDKGFGEELNRILARCRQGGQNVQMVAVGATHPKKMVETYEKEFGELVRVEVDLHVPPAGLTQRFVKVDGKEKLNELVAFLGEQGKNGGDLRGGRMMVFCNTMESCRFLDHFLIESGYTTACIHGDVPANRRESEYEKFKGGERQLLVCTDMAARGLDNLKVDHVVLFDFPTSAVDYIHRAGRTARAGAKGRVTSFVTKKDAKLARAIEKAGGMDTLESARKAREAERMRKKKAEEGLRQKAEEGGSAEVGFSQVRVEQMRRGKKKVKVGGSKGRWSRRR